ncbi:hypothetical protein GOODEAATRI_032470 [Goodea atripinnis]|uniref:Uncharacterized protein n=1 Tax=Goodea atripinnis TaxID=208336 RepID=A0ABV0Q2X0_9TELE
MKKALGGIAGRGWHSSWLALRLICFPSWMVKKKGPCELSRSIASNLQACPTRPQGLPAAHCHDGQLQQLINYAEAINALGKHFSDVLQRYFCLTLSLSPTAFHPHFKEVCRGPAAPQPVRTDGINDDNDT